MVVDRLKSSVILRITLDFDGSMQSTGRSGKGDAVGFNKKKKKRARSYYPLGVNRFESDAGVISNAADQR